MHIVYIVLDRDMLIGLTIHLIQQVAERIVVHHVPSEYIFCQTCCTAVGNFTCPGVGYIRRTILTVNFRIGNSRKYRQDLGSSIALTVRRVAGIFYILDGQVLNGTAQLCKETVCIYLYDLSLGIAFSVNMHIHRCRNKGDILNGISVSVKGICFVAAVLILQSRHRSTGNGVHQRILQACPFSPFKVNVSHQFDIYFRGVIFLVVLSPLKQIFLGVDIINACIAVFFFYLRIIRDKIIFVYNGNHNDTLLTVNHTS